MRHALRHLILAATLSGALGADAQKYSRFNEEPQERSRQAREQRERALDRKKAAEAWARKRGHPIRKDDGKTLSVLVDVENGKPVYVKTLNYNAAISTAADKVRTTAPFNLDGAGIKVGVWDGGAPRVTHQEFAGGRLTYHDSQEAHWHAMHVAGTIGASGVHPLAKGMAPAASVESYYFFPDIPDMTLAAASAPGETNQLYLSNHSYGYYAGWDDGTFYAFELFGQYHSYTYNLDSLIYNAQYYLPFWSAGNDRNDNGEGHPGDGEYKEGYDTISHHALAKNCMTVGAVSKAVSGVTRSVAAANMASFSSWGPADDGRIKPDIVADGVLVYSTDDDADDDYRSSSGTSMASPNACGSAALLVEYYSELFSGGAMRASSLKGLIIHTADELGRPGPDYAYGWGLMNTLAAANQLKALSEGNALKLTEAAVSADEPEDAYSFFWDGANPIRVTLCWTDPPGAVKSGDDDRSPDLVNDLDLRVVGPGGTNWPYKLSYAVPSANATTAGENNVDNVEQVYIAAPSLGVYTVVVDHDGSLSGGSQRYSLLISGDSGDTDADNIPDFWENQYFASPTGAVATLDFDGDGADNLTEYVAGTIPTDSNSVFKAITSALPTNGASYTVSWNAVEGRVYNVKFSSNLKYNGFTDISDDLPYPANSHTDTEDRSSFGEVFYRVDVRLDQ